MSPEAQGESAPAAPIEGLKSSIADSATAGEIAPPRPRFVPTDTRTSLYIDPGFLHELEQMDPADERALEAAPPAGEDDRAPLKRVPTKPEFHAEDPEQPKKKRKRRPTQPMGLVKVDEDQPPPPQPPPPQPPPDPVQDALSALSGPVDSAIAQIEQEPPPKPSPALEPPPKPPPAPEPPAPEPPLASVSTEADPPLAEVETEPALELEETAPESALSEISTEPAPLPQLPPAAAPPPQPMMAPAPAPQPQPMMAPAPQPMMAPAPAASPFQIRGAAPVQITPPYAAGGQLTGSAGATLDASFDHGRQGDGKWMRRIGLTMTVLISLLALFLFFVLARNNWSLDIWRFDDMLSRAFSLGTATRGGAELRGLVAGRSTLEQAELKTGKPVLLLKGTVKNEDTRARRFIYVRASLLRRGRAVLANEAPAGTVFTKGEVSQLTRSSLLAQLSPGGQDRSNTRVEAGASIAYMVVITNLPGDYDQELYSVQVEVSQAEVLDE